MSSERMDSIDDTTPLQSVSVPIPKEYTKIKKKKDDNKKNNHKDVCCCIVLCLIVFCALMYLCITVGQRNINKYG